MAFPSLIVKTDEQQAVPRRADLDNRNGRIAAHYHPTVLEKRAAVVTHVWDWNGEIPEQCWTQICQRFTGGLHRSLHQEIPIVAKCTTELTTTQQDAEKTYPVIPSEARNLGSPLFPERDSSLRSE